MPITYKQLAEICGVSRATVDRVMHNRGNVSPALEKRIRETAAEYNFRPNSAGRALALARNPIRIGVLIHLTGTAFFQRVMEGVAVSVSEINAQGGEVIIRQQPNFDSEEQIKLLEELVDEGVQAIAISPTQDSRIRNRLNQLVDSGIPVVTFNTEVNGLRRLSHVGADNVKGGRLGAYIMNLILGNQGGKVLIISGHLTLQANYQRVDGFVSECGNHFPGIEVMDLRLNADKEDRAYEITRQAIEDTPDLAGIYMVSGGQAGVCRALEETGLAGKIQFIAFDLLPETEEYLKKHVIQIILDQRAFDQGFLPPKMLFDYLFNDREPAADRMMGNFGVLTAHNI